MPDCFICKLPLQVKQAPFSIAARESFVPYVFIVQFCTFYEDSTCVLQYPLGGWSALL